MAQGDEDSMSRKHLRPRPIALALVLAVAGLATLAGCGSASDTGPSDAELRTDHLRVQLSEQAVTLSIYCVAHAADATAGNLAEAMTASDRLIRLAEDNPTLTDIDGRTMHQVLAREASDLRHCAPSLSDDLRL